MVYLYLSSKAVFSSSVAVLDEEREETFAMKVGLSIPSKSEDGTLIKKLEI
jgi:hypothetical protein